MLVRPLLGGVAVSPPLICEQEHLDEIAAALRAGLDALWLSREIPGAWTARRAAGGAGTANDGGAMSR